MPFQQVNTNDQNLQLIQDNVARSIVPLDNLPMTGGTVLSNVSLTSAQDNLIRHGLNHRPQYFIVVKIQANSNVWSPNTVSLNNSNADQTYINLRCSTSCTVSVWVN